MKYFTKGELLIGQDTLIDEMLFIRTGFCKVTTTNEEGSNSLTIWIAGRYDAVPIESFFLAKAHTKFDYEALTDGSAYRLEKRHFLQYVTQHPTVFTQLAAEFNAHQENMLSYIAGVNQSTIRDKLLHTLHSLASRFSASGDCDLFALGLPITHKDVAEMIGSTRESVTLELRELKKLGFISYNRAKFVIHTAKIAESTQIPA